MNFVQIADDYNHQVRRFRQVQCYNIEPDENLWFG